MSISTRKPVAPIATGQRGRYQTRDGYPVTVLKTGLKLPLGDSILGVIHYENHDDAGSWIATGEWNDEGDDYCKDLVETVRRGEKTLHVTFYPGIGRVGSVYDSAEAARRGGDSYALILPLNVPAPEEIVIVTEAVGKS